MTPQSETITWIPCSERLPDDEREKWVTTYSRIFNEIDVRRGYYYCKERNAWRDDDSYVHPKAILKIIAWTELPKGYQPEKGEG